MKTTPPSQPCRYFERRLCAGCTLLHEPYARQLDQKGAFVRRTLGELAAGRCEAVVPSPEPMGYRTSVKLCLHEDRYGKRAVGFYRPGGKEVVDVQACPAQVEPINRLAAKLFGRGSRPPARYYNHQGRVFQRGRLKFATLRAAPGGLALILSHTGVERLALQKWLKAIGLGDLCVYESKLTPKDGDLVTGARVVHLSGPEHLPFALGGRVFQLAPSSFFQANYGLSAGLVAGATAFRENGDVLLDLYGGFGAYSFAVAERFSRIFVVDGNAAAVDAARRQAKAAGLEAKVSATASFCESFLEKELSPDMARRVTHVIVNPPRGGLSRRVTTQLSLERFPALRELHYVSCNPETLARDLKALTQQGLSLRDARPYDMFPQTEHVETVVRLGAGQRA